MDEAFWSNVVKRWSEASETVIKLKKELAKAHEEVSFQSPWKIAFYGGHSLMKLAYSVSWICIVMLCRIYESLEE